MIYGYARVSSITQNIDRQIKELEKFNIPTSNIYVDYESGKDFIRTNYSKLINKLKKDDLLIIKSIDRLGRNYQLIIEQWALITKKIEANIFVIDFPLLDTRNKENGLIGSFISDIVLQILSFIAQNERENIKQRQKEGIAIAKAKGIHIGRPKYKLPKNFNNIAKAYFEHEITIENATKKLKMNKNTFIKYAYIYKRQNKTI